MKKTIALLLLAAILFSGCSSQIDFKLGKQLGRPSDRYTPHINMNVLFAYIIKGNCFIIIVDGNNIIQKIVEFSPERECCQAQGLSLIQDRDWEQFLGMSIEKSEEILGKPHVDIGSGFYTPAYITEDANLIYLLIDNDIIVGVIEHDL